MNLLLPDHPINHAGLQPVQHPRLGVTVNGQTAVRYLRFGQPVRLDRLELSTTVQGRWIPSVPIHPAHLVISVFDAKTQRWKTIREVDLPRDPRIEGKGLSQRLTVEQMDEHFARVLKKKPHVIPFDGLVTDHLRVECDREHPTWPNHCECNGGEFHVPFGTLNSLQAFGRPLGAAPGARYYPGLRLTLLRPRAPRGMTIRQQPEMLLFEGRRLAVGFSLRRPMLLHLGWDAFGAGGTSQNRLLATHTGPGSYGIASGGLSGPLLRTFTLDCLPHHWTGEVSVTGNQVRYRNLRCSQADLQLEAVFTVEPDRLLIEFIQKNSRAFYAIEAHVWRLAWNIGAAMTGAAATPILRPGRNGEVHLPMLWASDGVGCLSCQSTDDLRLQVESYRAQQCVVGGFFFETENVPAGERRATVELAVTNLEPKTNKRGGTGVRRHWSTVYSCFRPEYGGFSNHAISVNCHVNQHAPAEVVAFTRRPRHGPNPLDLSRFTIERALLDGGGYGYWRNLYLDSDPILVSAAGRIHQTEPNLAWLRRIEAGLLEAVQRMFRTIGREHLVICRALSGNAGSHRWSSNAMDVVGFGHLDAYVNAWSYRALRNATAMLDDLGQHDLALQCRERAAKLKTAFPKYLLNPKTGWVAGWRSRDGALHDYAFTWVNGPACAFGLVDLKTARRALAGLERLRNEMQIDSGVFGVPFNLLPIRRDDHMLPKIWKSLPTEPTFEFYTDGALATGGFYLRALSSCGLKPQAKKLAKEMDEGYAAGLWVGGIGSGVEFRSWDGLCTGYEGTFVGSFGALYAIAIEQGLFKPPQPEWWPANG